MTHVFWDVDTQVDFIEPDGKLYVQGAETIRANLARLTTFAREQGIRIIGSSDCHVPEDEELSGDPPDFQNTFPPHCMRGSAGQARIFETTLHDALIVEPDADPADVLARIWNHGGDILFHKRFFDVFTNPSVTPVIEALQVTEVTLYGVALDVCNRYAVEGLLQRHPSIAVRVVADAVRAINEGHREALFDDWRAKGVTTVATEDAIRLT